MARQGLRDRGFVILAARGTPAALDLALGHDGRPPELDTLNHAGAGHTLGSTGAATSRALRGGGEGLDTVKLAGASSADPRVADSPAPSFWGRLARRTATAEGRLLQRNQFLLRRLAHLLDRGQLLLQLRDLGAQLDPLGE